MPRKIGDVTKDVLVNAALPMQTKTYTVVSHQFIIDTIQQALKASGFEIEKETYRCTEDAQIASGKFIITYGDDPDLKMLYAFTNSYNKKVKFKSSIGAYVVENGAAMISRIDHLIRKHTGVAKTEIETSIVSHIANASEYFDQLKEHKAMMSTIEIDKTQFGSVLGELYMHGFINTDQISAIKKEYTKPVYTYTTGPNNLWTCYNHVISALRDSHPKKWLAHQVEVHTMFTLKYNLEVFDEDETSNEKQSDLTETSQENPEIKAHVETDEEYNARVAKTEGEPVIDLDAEEDADWEKHGMKEVVLEEPNNFKAETEVVTANELLEKHGDALTEEQVEEVKTHPSYTPEEIQEKVDQDAGAISEEESPFKDEPEINMGIDKPEDPNAGQFVLPGFEKPAEPIFKEEPVILGAESPEEEAQVKEALVDAGISPASNEAEEIEAAAQKFDEITKVKEDPNFESAGPEILNDSDGLNPEDIEKKVSLAPSYNEDLGEDDKKDNYPPEWDSKPEAVKVEEVESSNLFVEPEEGLAVGDLIQVETLTYKIVDFPEVEGELYMELELQPSNSSETPVEEVAKLVEVVEPIAKEEPEGEAGDSNNTVNSIEEKPEALLPEVPEKKEEAVVKHEEQVDAFKEVPIVETDVTFETDAPPVVPKEAEAEAESPEYKAIAAELDDLYGYTPKFTFTKEGSQYNVVLETEESIVLSEALVNARG
jgi:hypothetical protein